jgi:hypothetical protein
LNFNKGLNDSSAQISNSCCVPAGQGSPEWFLRFGLSHMIWKSIPGFLDYEVSERGDVRRGPKQLTPERTTGNGRKRFGLSKGGQLYRMKAHQLVALAFLGPAPFEGAEVSHKDGFHHNNHFSNLAWATSEGNGNDGSLHRLQKRIQSGLPRSRGEQDSMAAAQFLATALR